MKGKGDMRAVWAGKAFVPFGEGDLNIPAVMEQVLGSGYSGWLVVEQDVIPSPLDAPDRAQIDQVHNREVLRKWFP